MAEATIEKTESAINDVKSAAKEFQEDAAKAAQDFQDEAAKTMERAGENFEEFTNLGQQNFGALVESSRIAAKAMESMNAELLAFAKRTFQESVAASKDISSAKSLSEFVEKQTAYSRQTMEGVFGEASKLNEMMTSATKDVMQPLSDRVSATMDYAKSARPTA